MFRAGSLAAFAAFALLAFYSTPIASALPQGQEGAQQPSGGTVQSGMANAGPQKAEFDSQHRPITAGGFVKDGPIVFQDVLAGITQLELRRRNLFWRRKGQASACWITTMTAGWISIS